MLNVIQRKRSLNTRHMRKSTEGIQQQYLYIQKQKAYLSTTIKLLLDIEEKSGIHVIK